MKLLPSSLFIKNTAPAAEQKSSSSSSSWPFSTCTQSRTNSFRIFDTANTPESFFTNSSEGCASFSTTVVSEEDTIEAVINKGLRSERLFFKPDDTSSILDKVSIRVKSANEEEAEEDNDDEVADVPFKESVALSMDSTFPYVDFRKSMEEMVEAHGLKEWEHLEALLCWYLRVNGKSNHGYIIEAFVDLLVGLAFNSTRNIPLPSSSCSCGDDQYYSPTPLSFYTTSTSCSSSSMSSISNTTCVSSTGNEGSEVSTSTIPCLSSLLEAEDEHINEDDDGASS